MLSDFKNAFCEVFSGKLRPLMLKIALTTGGAWMLVLYVFWLVLGSFEVSSSAFLSKAVQILGFIGVLIGSLFFLPVLVSGIVGFFTESLVKSLNNGSKIPFKAPSTAQSLKISGKSALKSLASGAVFFPLTLLLGLFPVLNFLPPIAYCFVNGRVLGYEYFYTAALCLTGEDKANALYAANRAHFDKAGAIIAALMMIPAVNVVAPLVASAFMQKQITRLLENDS